MSRANSRHASIGAEAWLACGAEIFVSHPFAVAICIVIQNVIEDVTSRATGGQVYPAGVIARLAVAGAAGPIVGFCDGLGEGAGRVDADGFGETARRKQQEDQRGGDDFDAQFLISNYCYLCDEALRIWRKTIRAYRRSVRTIVPGRVIAAQV